METPTANRSALLCILAAMVAGPTDAAPSSPQPLEAVNNEPAQAASTTPTEVEQTLWRLQSYHRSTERVSSRTTERIDAVFDGDGRVSGWSGCNRYFADYRLDGDKIHIGPIAGTRKMCPEPPMVMRDEQAFLAALHSAARFAIADDRLTLYDADGKQVLVFRR